MSRQLRPEIREFILRNVEEHPTSIAPLAAKKFGLSRAGIGLYMSRLVSEGLLNAQGKTRARTYGIKPLVDFMVTLERDGLWNEDTVWREKIRPLMKDVPQNVVDICQYGFTEMVNNVLDHSQSPDVAICYEQTYAAVNLMVWDHGIGIFKKIRQDFKLDDERTALFELSKGKITSDKKRHSGEGVYFTSRMFDKFSILSGHLFYARERRDGDDWLVEVEDKLEATAGTSIVMRIATHADWTMRDVFEKYQGENVYFRKTHVPLKLGRYPGEQLVSRSQAKRVLARFRDFSEVILDFSGVSDIGQAFADEIFRVFKSDHPDTRIMPMHANKDVQRMIDYVQSDGATLPLPLPGPPPKT